MLFSVYFGKLLLFALNLKFLHKNDTFWIWTQLTKWSSSTLVSTPIWILEKKTLKFNFLWPFEFWMHFQCLSNSKYRMTRKFWLYYDVFHCNTLEKMWDLCRAASQWQTQLLTPQRPRGSKVALHSQEVQFKVLYLFHQMFVFNKICWVSPPLKSSYCRKIFMSIQVVLNSWEQFEVQNPHIFALLWSSAAYNFFIYGPFSIFLLEKLRILV